MASNDYTTHLLFLLKLNLDLTLYHKMTSIREYVIETAAELAIEKGFDPMYIIDDKEFQEMLNDYAMGANHVDIDNNEVETSIYDDDIRLAMELQEQYDETDYY